MQGGATGPPKVPPKLKVRVIPASGLVPASSSVSESSSDQTPSSPSCSAISSQDFASPSSPATPSSAAEMASSILNVPPALPYFSGANPLPSKNKDIPKPTSIRATQFAKLSAEVVETERTYINALSTMMSIYYYPLVRESACTCFASEQERILFGNFPQILELNRTFLEALETSPADTLGINFLKFIPFMKMYSVYCANFDAATELLEKLLTEDKFMEFQVFAQKCLAKTDGTTLSSYLIMPIQRIPRYKMLLHELVKFSDKTSLSSLQRALEEVKTVASVINEQIRARQNQTEIYALTQLFVGEDPQFLKPGRALLRRMDLVKQCRGGPKTFHFILFSDCLVYASSIIGKYKLHRKIPIDKSFRAVALPEQGDCAAKVLSSQKSFVVEFPDAGELGEWLEDMEDCVRDFHRGDKVGGGTQVKEPAAVLKSKNSSQTCQLCRSEFSVFNRAVHCRLCGDLFCRDCTKTKVPLNRAKRGIAQEEANESQKLKRICTSCAKNRQAESRKRILNKSAKAHKVVYEAFEALGGVPSMEPTLNGSLGLVSRPVRSSSIVGKGGKRGSDAPTIFDRVDSTHRRLDDLQKHGNVGSKIKKALKFEVKSKPLPKKDDPPDLAELQSELEGVVAARKSSFSHPEEQPHLVFPPRLSERLSDTQFSEDSKLEMQFSPSPSRSPEKVRSPDVRFHIRDGTPNSRTNGLPPLALSAATTGTATVITPRVRQSFTLRPPSRPPPAAPLRKTPPKPPEDFSEACSSGAIPLTSSLASSAMLASLSGSLIPSTAGFTFSKPPPLTSSFSSPSLFTQPKSPGLTVTRRSPRRSPNPKFSPNARSPLPSTSSTLPLSPSVESTSKFPARFLTSPSASLMSSASPSVSTPALTNQSSSEGLSSFSDEALAALPTLPRYHFSQYSTFAAPAAPTTPTPPTSGTAWELYDFDDEDDDPALTKATESCSSHSLFTSTSSSSPIVLSQPPSVIPSPMTIAKDAPDLPSRHLIGSPLRAEARVPSVSVFSPKGELIEPPTPPSLEPPVYVPDSPMKTIPAYLLSLHSKHAS